MFESLYPIFQETLKLAKIRERIENEVYSGKSYTCKDLLREKSPMELKVTEAETNLENYLSTQEHETINILMTIMYLGRDKDFNTIAEPGERFKALYDDLSSTFRNKEIDIEQMVSKVPLGSYLEQGFKILKISF